MTSILSCLETSVWVRNVSLSSTDEEPPDLQQVNDKWVSSSADSEQQGAVGESDASNKQNRETADYTPQINEA